MMTAIIMSAIIGMIILKNTSLGGLLYTIGGLIDAGGAFGFG
jgi:hypothetical protein